MGPDGAVNIIYREEIKNASDPEAMRQKLIQVIAVFHNPYVAASRGYIDDGLSCARRAKLIAG
jgi:acetyl-CoA carboxylase carboxyltransferase component